MNLLMILIFMLVMLLVYFIVNKKTRKQTLEQIQTYIGKIAYIVSAPIVLVIQLCFEFTSIMTDFILKLLHMLLLPFTSAGIVITHFDQSCKEKTTRYLKRYDGQHYIKQGVHLYKEALLKDTHSFVNITIQTVVLVGTIFLQYVSFATTYRGISFYFQEMAPGAAVLITFVIQCSLLVLANAIVHRQRFTLGRTLMLLYFMCTSMFFSYTGIVNQQISPEIDIRKNYQAFYKDYENLRNDMLSKSNQTADTFTITSLIQDANQLKKNSEAMRKSIEQSLKGHQEQLNASVKISYDEHGYPIYDTTNKDSTLLNLIDKENQQIQRLSQLEELLRPDELQVSFLKDASFAQKDMEEKQKLLNDPSTGYDEMKQAYDHLAQYMKSIDSNMEIKELPATLGSYYQSFALQKQLQEEKCMDYDTLRSQITTSKKDMTNVSDILQLQSLITKEINDNFINTDLSDQEFASAFAYYSTTLESMKDALQFEDSNLVALSRLHPQHKDFYTALFLLVLAIFVDGTTVLMPFFMNKTKKTILYATKRKDLRFEEEEILSDMLMGISKDPVEAMEKLEELFDHFSLTPYLQKKGYALQWEESQLHRYLQEDGSDMRECVLFLQHCGYMEYTTKEMLNTLRKEAGLSEIETEAVYLVKTNLVIWLKQNHAYAKKKSDMEEA
ncbi:hypothetical protein [[Eubacterium] hominis]|uniref:hypothetical protein n=1 Tax=[Eubacterium] hominis TaxID=2764325 RepID=UPI003A4E1686